MKIADFLYEVGQLKQKPRTGWHLLGIKHPESVADHTCRSVFISYILATMENVNAEKAALISAFHELPEARFGDHDKVAARYLPDKREIEKKIAAEQIEELPEDIKKAFAEFYFKFEFDGSPEHIVAKDADYLEVMLQAREYEEQGYKGARNWYENAQSCLKTESAKKLAAEIISTRPSAWYESLKNIKR